jgi:hypothetical protein
MALPGFTAEASVGPATQVYRGPNGYGIEAAVVSPQLMDGSEGMLVGGLGAEDLGGEDLGMDDLGVGDLETEGLEDDDLGGDGLEGEDLEGEGLEDDEMLAGDETEIEGVG